jgi:hypothetical protein
MELQSGVDKLGRPIPPGKKAMCHKGSDLVRGLLWQCAKCASSARGGNPAVRALFLRRVAAGDSAQVAWGYCMTKLLRQAYGVWTSNKPFDPKHETKQAAEREEKSETLGPQAETLKESADHEVAKASASLEPVSSEPSATPYCESAGAPDQASRRPIDYASLREQVSLQRVLERISRSAHRQRRASRPLPNPRAVRDVGAEVFRELEAASFSLL